MLERGRGGHRKRLTQLPDELPAVQGVQKIDVARAAVQHLERELPLLHEEPRRDLVGVAAVLELQLLQCLSSFPCRSNSRSSQPRPFAVRYCTQSATRFSASERRTETYLQIITFEKAADKVSEHNFQIDKSYALFYLIEIGRASCRERV